MDMKINNKLVKKLRQQKHWSQDQLAAASNISLRTVQRLEKSGACSLETKRALAAVFEISPEMLGENPSHSPNHINGVRYGYMGVTVGCISSYSGISYAVWTHNLPLGEAGIYYGFIGLIAGICYAGIGILSNYHNKIVERI